MTSSNTTAPITMMGSTSTLMLSDNDASLTDTLANSTTMDSANSYTSLINPSTSSLTDGTSDSSSPSSGISNSTWTSSLSGYHTHGQGSSLYNTTTLMSASYFNTSTVAYSSSSDSDFLSSSSDYSSSEYSSSSSSVSYSSSLIPRETTSFDSISEIYITTTSTFVSAVPYYPEPSSYPESTTVIYTQAYCFTDDDSTITTELPVTATVDSDQSSYTSQAIITTDFAFLANAVPGYKSSLNSNDNESSSNKGTVAGSVVGSVVGVALILFLLWFWLRRRQRSQRPFEKGFSHSIASTRRYDGSEYNTQEKTVSGAGSKFTLSSLVPAMFKTTSNSSSDHSLESAHSTGFGLGSLRSSILQDHQPSLINERTPIQAREPPFSRQPPTRSTRPIPPPQPRTIDTVMEEPEASSSSSPTVTYTKSKPQSYKSSRYQTAGLLARSSENPFDDPTTSRRIPPPPPPSRRANAYPSNVDYHRHGVNRHSINSVDSSIISDDTDDISSDESLILNGNVDASRSGGNTGFFREIV